jgi:hypothetical protein
MRPRLGDRSRRSRIDVPGEHLVRVPLPVDGHAQGIAQPGIIEEPRQPGRVREVERRKHHRGCFRHVQPSWKVVDQRQVFGSERPDEIGLPGSPRRDLLTPVALPPDGEMVKPRRLLPIVGVSREFNAGLSNRRHSPRPGPDWQLLATVKPHQRALARRRGRPDGLILRSLEHQLGHGIEDPARIRRREPNAHTELIHRFHVVHQREEIAHTGVVVIPVRQE